MPNPLEPRPRYFQGQYLGPEDLDAAVAYARAQNSRHALGAHSWGIAIGLTLKETPVPGGAVQVNVMPGYGWDGFGRPIAVLAPVRVNEALFAAQTYDPVVDAAGAGRLVPVWLRFYERHVQSPRSGFEVCDVEDQSARVREGFTIEIGPQAPAHDPIVVAGRVVDAAQALRLLDPAAPLVPDEAIPHQAFPAETDRARWLIPLGYVRWLPSPGGGGGFAPRKTPDDDDAARRLRRHVGVVAESVLAADGVVRVARRGDATSPAFSPPTEETLWISGMTRAEGDVRLAGGLLEWRDGTGRDRGTPLAIRRSGDAGKSDLDPPGDRALDVVIGPDSQTDNRLVIGPRQADGTVLPRAVVMSNGNVGIGTRTPSAKLEIFAGDLVLKGAGEDAGDLVFQRADGAEKARVWSKPSSGGSLHLSGGGATPHLTVAADGKIGIATDVPSNRLHVADATGIRQNRLYLTGGDGWSSLAYNAYHDGANGSWIFPDPGRRAMTIELDDLGGVPRCEIFSNTGADANTWVSRLKVDGSTGNIGVGHQAPTTKLHVMGDRVRLENGSKRLDLRTDGSAVDVQSETDNLYLRASGPMGRNNLVLNPNAVDGMVAIGLDIPICKLHVAGNISGSENLPRAHVALIDNTSAAASGDVLALRVSSPTPTANNNFVTFFGGARGLGAIEAKSGGVTYWSGSADFAEALPRKHAQETIGPGDVVGIVEGMVTKVIRGAHHVAVVSTNPIVLGNVPQSDRRHLHVSIAFIGQAPVKVRGPVQAGMYLIPSGDEDGTAIAIAGPDLDAARAAVVVARAWQSVDGDGVHLVHAVVGWGTQEAALAEVVRKQASTIAALESATQPTKKRGAAK